MGRSAVPQQCGPGNWHTGHTEDRSGRPRIDDLLPRRKTRAAMELLSFLPLIIIMGAFMFFASRRQRKAMQATVDLQGSLRVGDRVHTTSGLQATIAGIGEDTVDLEIAPGVVTRWVKLAVRDRIVPEAPEIGQASATGQAFELDETDADRLSRD